MFLEISHASVFSLGFRRNFIGILFFQITFWKFKEYILNYWISDSDALSAVVLEIILWVENVTISWILPKSLIRWWTSIGEIKKNKHLRHHMIFTNERWYRVFFSIRRADFSYFLSSWADLAGVIFWSIQPS